MTNLHAADRTPEDWQAQAQLDQEADAAAVRTPRNPWMIVLTALWIVLLLGGVGAQLGARTVDPDTLEVLPAVASPAALILFLSAGFVAVAQIVALAIRWTPKDA